MLPDGSESGASQPGVADLVQPQAGVFLTSFPHDKDVTIFPDEIFGFDYLDLELFFLLIAADLNDFYYGYDNVFQHTPQDMLDKLSPGSMQIVGDTVLETTRTVDEH